jgi:hypothetical protein
MIAGAADGVMRGVIQNAQNDAQFKVQSASADASNMLSKDQADNTNSIRTANNEFIAAQASLANTQRSIGNQQKAAAIGAQANAQTENTQRTLDAVVRGSVETQIQAAATLGAMRVAQATSGTGGSAAEIMRSTMKQTQAREAVQTQARTGQISFDAAMQAAGMRSNLITSQDYGTSVAAINLQTAIPQTTLAPMKMPDLSIPQMALMGAAGGGGFQQFSQSNNRGNTIGYTSDNSNGSGGIGQTNNYSSSAVMNGVNSAPDSWTSSNAGGGNTYDFNLGNSGGSSGGGQSSSSNFNFSLS